MADPINRINTPWKTPDVAADGGPAFPVSGATAFGFNLVNSTGMSLRDHFAGLAMQSFVLSVNTDREFNAIANKQENPAAWLASMSYETADAMLAARKSAV